MVESSQNLKVETPYGLVIPFPYISYKDGKSVHIRGTYTAVVIAAVFTLASI